MPNKPKLVRSSINWPSKADRAEANAKAEDRGHSLSSYIVQHFRKLPRLTDAKR